MMECRANESHHNLVRPMAVMPIDVKTTTAKFTQLVAIERVLSAAAINTITLEAR